MITQAVLKNGSHPEYGVATIPFPIPHDQYDKILEMLEEIGIGDAVQRDCMVEEINGGLTVLKCLEGNAINIDEMNYLAKRIESFDGYEEAQFQGMASRLGTKDMTDLINLTFCCQKATVVTNFNNLAQVGYNHYLTTKGGAASTEELANVDLKEVARSLIMEGNGYITPYGVVYSNGMQIYKVYTKGNPFPYYRYEDRALEVEMTSGMRPYNAEKGTDKTWLFLPMSQGEIRHALLRSGLVSVDDMRLRFSDSTMPEVVDAALDFEREGIMDLNRLAEVVQNMSEEQKTTLAAAVDIAKPESALEVTQLAINRPQFVFYPGVDSAKAYGKYMIQESGRFEFDPELEEFYDYEKYGQLRLDREDGEFVAGGYIVYEGAIPLDELMKGDPVEQDVQMGGLSM